jgi:hypothetical protein
MNQVPHIIGLKSLEKLLMHSEYVICQQTGQKITRVDDLATVHLEVGEEQYIILPVHKESAKNLLKTMLDTFSKGLPSCEDKEPLEFQWRD